MNSAKPPFFWCWLSVLFGLFLYFSTHDVRAVESEKPTNRNALTGPGDVRTSRAMVAAGALSLSLAGQHQTPTALAAGNWLLAHPFTRFGEVVGGYDRFFYGAYYCSQAAVQLGGRYWEGIYPPLVNALLNSQSPDGSWPVEIGHGDSAFGNGYTTAMAVLSLTPPYQLLPVFQR